MSEAENYDFDWEDIEPVSVTCKYCGQKNLHWSHRQLVDSRGRKHHCNVFTGKRCMDLEPKFDPIIGAPYRERP
jgi:hypothetical protein